MEVNSFMDFFIARNRANFEEIARPIDTTKPRSEANLAPISYFS